MIQFLFGLTFFYTLYVLLVRKLLWAVILGCFAFFGLKDCIEQSIPISGVQLFKFNYGSWASIFSLVIVLLSLYILTKKEE